MGNLRPFQIVLLGVFGALAIGGVIMLGAYQASVSREAKIYGDEVLIWGTLPERPMGQYFEEITHVDREFEVVKYVEVDERNFDNALVNAIAENRGPDMIILPSEKMVSFRSKLTPISYETFPLRTFKDIHIDGTEIFTFPEGIYAVPFAADPLMLYWNRDLFASNGFAQAPRTWEEMVNLIVPGLAIVDTKRNVLQSALAFGEYRNLVNPKAMILTLAMQSGSQMVYLDENKYTVALDTSADTESVKKPMGRALEFFTEFSNSNSPLYTWNRVQSNDLNAFLAGELAMYVGFASEYVEISEKNPNLNFDAAPMPQGETATIKRTFGNYYGFAIPQTSFNANGAYQAALTLTSPEYAAGLADMYGMVSTRRDVLAQGAANPVTQAAMSSALFSRGWFDPSVERTDVIFQDLVDGVVSNRERVTVAVKQAVTRVAREFD